MRKDVRWFVAVVVGLLFLTTWVSGVTASPSQRSLPRQDGDGQFFAGNGPGLRGPFRLLGGKYYVDLWARDNPLVDPNDYGCVFGSYLDGLETPVHLTLSAPLRVTTSVPWHYTPTVAFPAGQYKLAVLPGSDCGWSVTILRLGTVAPAIQVVAARSYLHRGTTFSPTTVVHMGQTIDFAIYYRIEGSVSGKPAGTITIAAHGKAIGSFPLHPWQDPDGTDQLYTNLIFTPGGGVAPGPAIATFAIAVGSLHARESLDFTFAR